MWKKEQEDKNFLESPVREMKEGPSLKATRKMGYIGESIIIKGELSGNEDLTIDGKVEGKIELKDHNLTIGSAGRIFAEIFAKSVTITGEVDGNVRADEKIEISNSGKMRGDIIAPRVTIADGAQFKGSVDMGNKGSAVFHRDEKLDEQFSEKEGKPSF